MSRNGFVSSLIARWPVVIGLVLLYAVGIYGLREVARNPMRGYPPYTDDILR